MEGPSTLDSAVHGQRVLDAIRKESRKASKQLFSIFHNQILTPDFSVEFFPWLPWWSTKSVKWNISVAPQVVSFSRLFTTAAETLSQTLCLYLLHENTMKGKSALNLLISTLCLKTPSTKSDFYSQTLFLILFISLTFIFLHSSILVLIISAKYNLIIVVCCFFKL